MNDRIYKSTNYRKVFDDLFHQKRQSRPGWSTAILAERIRVQPSHITNVVKERSHFSSDQVHAIGVELGLTDEEINYIDLLMEWERAEFPNRKNQLKEKIQGIREQKLRIGKELKSQPLTMDTTQQEAYYLDPNVELIHLYLGVKNAPTNVSEIADRWGLATDYVEDIIVFLEKAGLIVRKQNKWIVKPIHQLLPTTSPLCKPQQMLKRVRAFEAIQKLNAKQVYSFNATITMNEETKLKIQSRFVEFLKEVEQDVIASPSEEIYHLQFDLFPWLPKSKLKL